MRNHLAEIDDLVRQLKTAGAKMETSDLVSQLFITLPSSYDPLVLRSKRTDRADYCGEEKSTAFVGGSFFKKKFKGKCHRCGKVGHMQKDCRSKMQDRNANSVVVEKTVSFMVKSQLQIGEKELVVDSFIVDSGCSDHLINNRKYLKNIRKLNEPFVVDVAKDGVTLVGEYEGSVTGKTKEGITVEIKNVIYLPDLRSNLLSVKKMSEAGIDVLFTRENGCEKAIMKHMKEVIAVAHMRRNLYELQLELETTGSSASMCTSEVSTLWHRRLGHASQHSMDTLVRHNMAVG